MTAVVDASAMPFAERRRFTVVRLLDVAIASLVLAVLALTAAGTLAPRLYTRIDPAAVSSDGGHAFTFAPGFATHWPYAVPSHPDFKLSSEDVQVTEDNRRVGVLEPDHAVIREKGGGLYNLWGGTLWFSPSDDSDPRTNGRDYRVDVRTRLDPSVATARSAGAAVVLVLILWRIGPLALRHLSRLGDTLERRFGLITITKRIPLTFGRTFALASGAALAALAWGNLARPMPLLLSADSIGYIGPGLIWASGGDMTGQSARHLGYPWLTLISVRLGSLAAIPKLQLLMVIGGLVCTLGVLYLAVASLARRLGRLARIPRWVLAVGAALAAVAYIALLSAHDLFMLDVDSAMAEAPHFLPSALTLAFFVAGFAARSARTRVAMLVLASFTAYTSVMFKPNTLLVLALCLATLVVAGLRHWRSFRSPVVLGACVIAAACAMGIQRFDARATPLSDDFGPKTLFCNHLDVIEPVLGVATPERLRIRTLSREVLSQSSGWPIMGFDGDQCMYGSAFTEALAAASGSEGVTPGQWEQREFIKAVIRNPLGYGRDVTRQIWSYLTNPTNGMDAAVQPSLTETDWKQLENFAKLPTIQHDTPDEPVESWVRLDHPRFAAVAKRVLNGINVVFAPVTLGSTVLALLALVRFRNDDDLRPEIVVLATAVFTSAFVGTTALSHTFDVARYATDVLPFSLLWWMLGIAYLAHLAVLAGISARRATRSEVAASVS